MLDLSALVRDPSAAAKLTPAERAQAVQQCAAVILAISSIPVVDDKKQSDNLLTAQQVADKLNLSLGWVRDNTDVWLKRAKVKAGGALRFSEAVIDRMIRERQGE